MPRHSIAIACSFHLWQDSHILQIRVKFQHFLNLSNLTSRQPNLLREAKRDLRVLQEVEEQMELAMETLGTSKYLSISKTQLCTTSPLSLTISAPARKKQRLFNSSLDRTEDSQVLGILKSNPLHQKSICPITTTSFTIRCRHPTVPTKVSPRTHHQQEIILTSTK